MNTEYENSRYASASNAQAAYDRGYTGKGVTVAVVDSGIDIDNSEFAGRITASSRSFETRYAPCGTCAPESVTYDLNDVQGHGTLVASVAAGARNGQGTHGIAYDADIMALKIGAADMTNVTPGITPPEAGVNSAQIAPAIRYAVENGAFVINLSLNGFGNGSFVTEQNAAMDQVRLNNRLVVQSVQNDAGDSFAGQITENLVGADFENKEWFLFGIRLNPDLTAPTINGAPGALADRTLAVVAQGVYAVGIDGQQQLVSGNSFAAPAIAGAAALLKQYWPQLGGREISQILLTTARDLGAPGVDQVYGVGLMDIQAAFNAQAPAIGTSSAKMSSVNATSIVFSPAFGGGDGQVYFSQNAGTAVVLDRFGRDYALDVRHLAGSIQAQGISLASLTQPHSMSRAGQGLPEMAAFNASSSLEAQQNPLPTGNFAFRLGPSTTVDGTVNGSIDSSNTMTGSMLRSSGIATFGQAFNLRSNGRTFGIAFARSEQGNLSSETSSFNMELRNGFTLGYTSNRETGAVLGMRGTGAFNIEGARSNFVTAGWTGELGSFKLAGEAMLGHTRVRSRDTMIEFSEPVISSGFRAKALHDLFGGLASLGITSPIRVERARVHYTLPTSYNLDTRQLENEVRMIDLAPSAREFNFEAGWARVLGRRAYLKVGAAYGVNSGHQRGQQSGAAWIQLSNAF